MAACWLAGLPLALGGLPWLALATLLAGLALYLLQQRRQRQRLQRLQRGLAQLGSASQALHEQLQRIGQSVGAQHEQSHQLHSLTLYLNRLTDAATPATPG